MNISIMPSGFSALTSAPVCGEMRSCHESFRHRPARVRHSLQRLAHEMYPDRQRGLRALLALAQRALLVEADPDRCHQIGREAIEPGVLGLVGRAGLAGNVGAVRAQRARTPVPCLITSAIMSVMS